MSNKINILVSIAMGSVSFLLSCRPAKILYNSSQIQTSFQDTLMVTGVRHAFWSDSIIVKTSTGKKYTLAPEKVWGIQYKNGVAYRNYHGRFYLIKANDAMVIYYIYEGGHQHHHDYYFFSKNLDAPIYTLDKYNLTEQFADNNCFVEKINQLAKELKWYQTYSAFEREKGTYKILELYKQCQ